MKQFVRTCLLVLALGVLTMVTAWVHLAQFSVPLDWDAQVFFVIGHWLHQGLWLYRDVTDLKPPGIFLWVAGVFAVLPDALWSVRLADFALFTGASWAFYGLCRHAGAAWMVAVAGAGLWAVYLHHPFFDLGGLYTEQYLTVFAVFAMAAAVYGWPFVAGLCAASAALFKHPGIVVLLPICLLCPVRQIHRVLLGVAVPFAVLVMVYFVNDLTGDLWRAMVIEPQQFAQVFALDLVADAAIVRQFFPLVCPPWLLAAVLAATACAVGYHPSRALFAAVAWLGATSFGCASQGTFWAPHYWIPFFAPLIFLAIVSVSVVPKWVQVATLAVCTVLAAAPVQAFYHARQPAVLQQWVVLKAGPSAWRTGPANPAQAEVGEWIKTHTAPTDRIYVAGFDGQSIGIYWYADRRSASPVIWGPLSHYLGTEAEVQDDVRRHADWLVRVGLTWANEMAPAFESEPTISFPTANVTIWRRRP